MADKDVHFGPFLVRFNGEVWCTVVAWFAGVTLCVKVAC